MVTNSAAAQMNHQQLAMQQQAIAHEREMAKRRSRKPTDLNISEEIQELVPNGDTYAKFRDFERRMDATVMRKRLDVQESARNYKVCQCWCWYLAVVVFGGDANELVLLAI